MHKDTCRQCLRRCDVPEKLRNTVQHHVAAEFCSSVPKMLNLWLGLHAMPVPCSSALAAEQALSVAHETLSCYTRSRDQKSGEPEIRGATHTRGACTDLAATHQSAS